jgi:hypothetical protein
MPEDTRSTKKAETDPPADDQEQGTEPQPPRRSDARIGSAGGGPYPLADPSREAAQET